TAFSEETFGPKPWKAGYGPRGKGVVFAGSSRQVIVRGLTCPHSARLRGGALWLCNSGYGELGVVEGVTAGASHYEPVARVPGFTRGLAFAGNYAFVGLSKVIDFYEPYAPGLPGSHVTRALVARGADVSALVRRGSDPWRVADVLPRLELVSADLAESEASARALQDAAAEVVCDLAWHGVGNRFHQDPSQ